MWKDHMTKASDSSTTPASAGGNPLRAAQDSLLVDLRRLRDARDALALEPREAAVGRLGVVVRFINTLAQHRRAAGEDVPLDLVDQFLELGLALMSLDEGAVEPLLAPTKTGSRSVPLNEAYARAQAAAAMQALLRIKHRVYDLERAARAVARELRGSPLLAKTKGAPWQQVMTWRNAINKAAGKGPEADPSAALALEVEHYRAMVGALDEQIAHGGWGRARIEQHVREQCAALQNWKNATEFFQETSSTLDSEPREPAAKRRKAVTPEVSAAPDPERLPRYADRRGLAAIIGRFYGPISPRSLEEWPIAWRCFNGRIVGAVAEALAEAERRFEPDPAPSRRPGRADPPPFLTVVE
jgi:hypothetical protein